MPDRLIAEYAGAEALVAGLRRMREHGYAELEVYMPFPSVEVEDALEEVLERRRSRLPWVIGAVGLAAAGGAYVLQWLLVAKLYPLIVGGRPPHFPLTFVPITFEMGVLFASFTAFFGVLRLGRLFRLTDPVQSARGTESITRDRFWLEVLAVDPKFDLVRTQDELVATGALRIESPPEEVR